MNPDNTKSFTVRTLYFTLFNKKFGFLYFDTIVKMLSYFIWIEKIVNKNKIICL